MKSALIGLGGLVLGGVGGYFLAPNSSATAVSGDVDLSTPEAKISYHQTYGMIEQFKATGFEVNGDAAMRGIEDALSGAVGLVNDLDFQDAATVLGQRMAEKQEAERAALAEANKAAGAAFLAEKAALEGVTVLESGLILEPLTVGDGIKPEATDVVKVHYHGTLPDGTVFDSSKDRGEPIEFPLNRVIPGWTEGLQEMSVGSTYNLYIPSDLAYGETGSGQVIGPNNALAFEVQLLDVIKPDAEAVSE